MAFSLYFVGLIVFVTGLGWLLTALGVAPAIVNPLALALLVAGLAAGFTGLRLSSRA
jgi:hypothetical protein